jgi:pimeloyl-ACP methyl ester carboxylesterase
VSAPFERGRFEELPDRPRRPHRYFESKEKTVRLESRPFGSIEIAYREMGGGPPLLLIHGLMTSSYSWRYVMAPLAEHFRLIVPDLPGSGRSSKPLDRSYRAAAFAECIGELCAALSLRGVACVGNSLGGYLAMRAAIRDPGLFSSLVNVHSPGLPELRLSLLRIGLSIPGMKSGLAWWIRRDPLRWAHANVHYWDESLKSREEAEAYGVPLSTPEGSRAFVRILSEVLHSADVEQFASEIERLETFPIPLLLVYARSDPMVPPRIGERLAAKIRGARLVWLDDTSHFAHVDSPDRLLPIIAEHLRGPAA